VSPIRRVLNMLSGMSVKVQKQVKDEEKAFDKFMCYCKTTVLQLDSSIAGNDEKLPQLQSSVEESSSMIKQLESDITEHSSGKQAAESAISEQDQLRSQEKQKFKQESQEMATNIENLQDAIKVLANAGGGSFLQSKALDAVRSMAQKFNADRFRTADRDQLVALLESMDRIENGEGGEEGDASQDVGEIRGILAQMLDDMTADLADMKQKHADGEAEAQALTVAKKKEIETLQLTIEEKHKRLSDTKVEVVQLKGDLVSTRSGLESDTNLLADLNGQCGKKKDEHEEIMKAMSNELMAIQEASKILSADTASDAFKKTSAGVSFLQVGSSDDDETAEAAQTLKQLAAAHNGDDKFSLLAKRAANAAFASHKRKGRGRRAVPEKDNGFGKISKLVDQMLDVMAKEQEDDTLKFDMCKSEIGREETRKTGLDEQIEAKSADIGAAEGQKEMVTKDIESLRAGIAALDESVKDFTQQRKDGHQLFLQNLADINEALGLLRVARERLAKYYGAKLLQEQQLQGQQQDPQQAALAQTSGSASDESEFGFFASDNAADGANGNNAADGADADDSKSRAGPPKLQAEGGGVIQMISEIEGDMQKEVTEEKANEATDQTEYEKFMKISAEKRETDAKALSVRIATMAEVSENHRVLSRKRNLLRGELEHTQQVIVDLHKECDWLVTNYDDRKNKRAEEVEALKRTKSVLAGAKFGLVQVNRHRH